MGSLTVCTENYKAVETGNGPLLYGYVPSGDYIVTHVIEGKGELVLAFANWAMTKMLLYARSGEELYDMAYKLYFQFNHNKNEVLKLLNDYCKSNGISVTNIDALLKLFGCGNIENRHYLLGFRHNNCISYKLPYVKNLNYGKYSTNKYLFKSYRIKSFMLSPEVLRMDVDKYHGVYYVDGEYNDENTEKFKRVVKKCELAGIEPPHSMIDGLCILDGKQHEKLLLTIAHVLRGLNPVEIGDNTRLGLQYAIDCKFVATSNEDSTLHLGNVKKLENCDFYGMNIEIDSVEQIEECLFRGCSIKINRACDLSEVVFDNCAVRIRGGLYNLHAQIYGKNVIKLDKLPDYLNIEAIGRQAYDTDRSKITGKCRNLLCGHGKNKLLINEKVDTSNLCFNLVGVDDGLLDVVDSWG